MGDIVVFGRACANTIGELHTPGEDQAPLKSDAGMASIDNLDKMRYADGQVTTADLRLQMQQTMQNNAAVYRTEETLKEGVDLMEGLHKGMSDLKTADRGLVWNSDLIETLELQNLMSNAQ